jgi:hypothetical protein
MLCEPGFLLPRHTFTFESPWQAALTLICQQKIKASTISESVCLFVLTGDTCSNRAQYDLQTFQ